MIVNITGGVPTDEELAALVLALNAAADEHPTEPGSLRAALWRRSNARSQQASPPDWHQRAA